VHSTTLADRIDAMVDELLALRAEVSALQAASDAVAGAFDRASLLLHPTATRRGVATTASVPRRAMETTAVEAVTAKPGRGRGRAAGTAARQRATPSSVTPQVVMAAIAKLGSPTAGEIAAEISRLGTPVGGRAIRFLAQHAGATVTVVDGSRRYSLPTVAAAS